MTVAAILNFVGAFISLEVAATVAERHRQRRRHHARRSSSAASSGRSPGTSGRGGSACRRRPRTRSSAASIGATLVAAGSSAIDGEGILSKVIVPAILSPLLAGLIAAVGVFLVYRIIRRFVERAGRAPVPLGAGRLVVDGRARARHERRAEDDGRDLAGADRERQPHGRRRLRRARPGSSSRARPRSRSGPTRAAGGSSRRSARRSSRSGRRRASAPRRSPRR